MTEPAERLRRKATDPVSRELASLRGRSLGTCTKCGEAVFRAQSFTRFGGCVAHVRCATGARAATPPVPVAARERRPTR